MNEKLAETAWRPRKRLNDLIVDSIREGHLKEPDIPFPKAQEQIRLMWEEGEIAKSEGAIYLTYYSERPLDTYLSEASPATKILWILEDVDKKRRERFPS